MRQHGHAHRTAATLSATHSTSARMWHAPHRGVIAERNKAVVLSQPLIRLPHSTQCVRPLAAPAAAGAGAAPPDSPLEAIIADVLNANRTPLLRPADLLDLIDASGNGLTTTISRSWDCTSAGLSLQGEWRGCAQARRMAMLAVYQERCAGRAASLLRLLRWLHATRPGLLDGQALSAVEAAATGANPLNPAVEQLQLPQLAAMAAALLPWHVLVALLESGVSDARAALLRRAQYSPGSTPQAALLLQLQWVEASLARGAGLSRLRALLDSSGDLPHWQAHCDDAAAAAAAASTADKQDGGGLRSLPPEQAFLEAWRAAQTVEQQQQQQQPLHAVGAAALLRGKNLVVGFRQRDTAQPWCLTPRPGAAATVATAAGAAGSTAGGGLPTAEGPGGGEVQLLCSALAALTQRIAELRAQLPGGREATIGVLPTVQEAALIDALVAWADASPATSPPPQPVAAAARVALSSIEHDRLLRRIGISAAGPEVPLLRRLAVEKGRSFLAHFSPRVGDPFHDVREWDYFREAPGMWTRFVQDPPTVSAVLTIKELHPTSAPQLQLPQAPSTSPTTPGVASSAAAPAAALAEVELSPGELGALLQELMAVLPAAAASAATTHDTVGAGEGAGAAALGTPGARPVGLLPLADGRLQLTVSGVVVAVLSPGHVSSLVTVLDDVVMQMPGQFDPPDLAVEVTPPPRAQQAARAALAALVSAARAAAVAALLAVPLLSIVRPYRGLQLLPPASAASSTAVTVCGSADAGAGAAAAPAAAGRAAAAAAAVPTALPAAVLQELCSREEERLIGAVWLPESLAGAANATMSSGANDNVSNSGVNNNALVYQLVVDATHGGVLGLRPCSQAATAAMLELPQAAELRGVALQRVHSRRRAAVNDALSGAKGALRRSPRPSSGQVGHILARESQLPASGAAVLRLELLLPAASTAGDVELGHPEQQQQQVPSPQAGGSSAAPARSQLVFGSGRSTSRLVLMQPRVTPWTDADSLELWASMGAEVQQPQPMESSTAEVPAAAGLGGLQLQLDGQPVQSLETLLQQLLVSAQTGENVQ